MHGIHNIGSMILKARLSTTSFVHVLVELLMNVRQRAAEAEIMYMVVYNYTKVLLFSVMTKIV